MLFRKSEVSGDRGIAREANRRARNRRLNYVGGIWGRNNLSPLSRRPVIAGEISALANDFTDQDCFKGTANPRIFKQVKSAPNVSEWI